VMRVIFPGSLEGFSLRISLTKSSGFLAISDPTWSVTLLLHSCYTIVTQLLRCYYPVVS
jgi:hypothetical protein